jgi:hypothetical protein
MTSTYCYINMAILDHETRELRYSVARLWAEKVGSPEIMCGTGSHSNCELISSALNASIGLTDDQAEELATAWISADIDNRK